MVNVAAWKEISAELAKDKVTLVAVSKTKPVSDIQDLYDLGQRDFGENYVQELEEKQAQLPTDIRWHYIGHLQSNKVKYIAGYTYMIHAVDSFKLLLEINKQATKHNRTIKVLLQLHIADEETKHGMDEAAVLELLDYYEAQRADLQHVQICGVMGMATFTDDTEKVRAEFKRLHNFFVYLKQTHFIADSNFSTISMGMSGDYKIAVEESSTMVRVGSLLFGHRDYTNA
ncbi:MAG: YggS family pyridoxal phosphate enzyme [Bacteroidetes bacterium 43-93]|nr:YggS family pyridoxal phosphate-dependent enzyme [Bacteroidota bacterium]OJX00317.1 MAG: YggS family pyridoxal phosphate enzyme [Bacteroidetes bacterium 43-93]